MTLLQWIELISAILGIIGVWLNTKPHILGWPIGIVSVVLAAIVYFESRLFAEFGLQIFYTLSGFYGWWKWNTEKAIQHTLYIQRISKRQLLISILTGIALTLGIGYFLKNNTSADFLWIDSALAAFSFIGQIWLARKFIENWILWGFINLFSISLYFYKGLWFFLAFFSVLFVMSVWGYVNWRKKMKAATFL